MMQKEICKCCGKETYLGLKRGYCFECQEKPEAIKEFILAGEKVDTGSSKYIYCPYCGEAIETDLGYCDFPELYEEGDHVLTCPECDREFNMYTNVSYYYETEKLKEGEE